MEASESILWKPLLESAAQTIVGAIGSYAFAKVLSNFYKKNTFDGPMDFWKRGVMDKNFNEGDNIHFDGLISPYTQLFPGNPYFNALRWNKLHNFEGKISISEYNAMEFFCGSDAALRIGSLNGETLVGLFHRYGFVGEGLIGVAPTKLIQKMIPNFFNPKFFGARALISGKISRCPSQHGFIAQGISSKVGLNINIEDYKNLWYLQINSIKLFSKASEKTASLLGSSWAVSDLKSDQYLIQYGYISNETEKLDCVEKITKAKGWNKAKVFYDDLESPSESLSFKRNFII